MTFASWGDTAQRTRLSWAVIERQRARIQAHREAQRNARQQAAGEVLAIRDDHRAKPVSSGMLDSELRVLAEQRADLMAVQVAMIEGMQRADWFARLGLILGALDARPFGDGGQDTAGIVARVRCAGWWVRQLRRAAIEAREREGRAAGQTCARRRQPYVTDDTMRRVQARDRANAALLERTEIESQGGDVLTLAEVAKTTNANPAIRRGELMTRIKGCEAWADANGWVGLFTTNTTPSRFHAIDHGGRINAKWLEAAKPTPKDGQRWLCETWAKVRAKLARLGVDFYGFRVAEPHHDGTPHWHMLIWCKPADRDKLRDVMRAGWLADCGTEKGASRHRFTAKRMDKGGATGYVAKYIAKGIDDEGDPGASGHLDDLPDGRKLHMAQADMLGGGAARVRAWARAHGIRQFQAMGQPPVTVWRELRRVDADQVTEDAPVVVRQCWHAVNRDGEKLADFGEYMQRQGGACVGRRYRVRLVTEDRERVGRYETALRPFALGVADLFDPLARVVRSNRQEWKPRGTWQRAAAPVAAPRIVGVWDIDRARALRARPKAAQPRTRGNNCTGRVDEAVGRGEPNHGNNHGRTNPGAHRLPHMRHPQRDADHARQERRPVRLL